ncbi:hypothetical protein ACFODL_02390 [Phenylobacterium terrae]|uniref:Uncharacterized protein n=1 Tax=Phenylobacterium terrae TaxID=2665495 RepID=A0ABW4N4B2_9CAUL
MRWPEGWTPVDDAAEAERLQAELAREVPRRHLLDGERVTPFARAEGADDVLFAWPDGRVAQVHLTWAVETDPAFPATQIYADLEDWLRRGAGTSPAMTRGGER